MKFVQFVWNNYDLHYLNVFLRVMP